jgi:cytidine deaminase
MGKWDFKTIRLNSMGTVELMDISSAQERKTDKYSEALEIAAKSVVAKPPFSNYFCKESVGLVSGEMVPAGNIEYGICQALHGEESAVAAFRARYGRSDTEEIILGIIEANPGNVPLPCGNCRDIMLEDFGSDFEIVSGTADGGVAVVTNMSQFLFSNFADLAPGHISSEIAAKMKKAIQQGNLLTNDAYSPKNIHPERRYHALIATNDNDFVGARDVMCDYHPIYALRDAVRQARRAKDPFMRYVVIVCEDFCGGAPHVMYKDRQHLLELNLQAELIAGLETNPTVYLATYRNPERVISIWRTNVKEWIPLPFSPREFGQEFIDNLTKYFLLQKA